MQVASLVGRLKRLASGSLAIIGSRLLGAGVGFLTQFLLVRLMGATELGIFYAASSLASVLAIIAAQGYPQVAARFVGRYRNKQDGTLAGHFAGHAMRDGFIAATVAALGVSAWALLWPALADGERLAFVVAGWMVVAIASLNITTNLAGGMRAFALCYMPEGLIKPILFFVVIAAAGLAHFALSGASAMVINAVITALLAVAVLVLVGRRMPHIRWRDARPALAARWRNEAWQLLLLAIFTNFFADACILATTPFLTRAETAVFGLCLKLALLVGYFVQIGQQMVVPDMADAAHAGDQRRLWTAAWRSIKLPAVLSGAALAAVLVFGRPLLSLFGPEFADGQMVLSILIGAQLLRALSGPGAHLLTLEGNQTINMALAVSSLMLLVGLSAALCSFYGITGGAIAVLLVQAYFNFANVAVLRYLAKPPLDLTWVMTHRPAAA